MKCTPEQIGDFVRSFRRKQGVTQRELAMTSGTGLRFIIDLEKGKATCQIGKVLTVLHTLGIKVTLMAPPDNADAHGQTARTPAEKHLSP
jgi:HTH-type transcriptional regulator/antitoxin HipB